jgi:hypothetical protein
MTTKQMIRQGDVLLIPIEDAMPIAPRPTPVRKLSRQRRLILAEGESSLHEHTLDASDAELVRQGERMLLWIEREQPLVVTHSQTGEVLARHTPIKVGTGLYEVRIQRRAEITPADMPQRFTRVRD